MSAALVDFPVVDPNIVEDEKEGEVAPAFFQLLKEVAVGITKAAEGWKAQSARIAATFFMVAVAVFQILWSSQSDFSRKL